MDERTDAVSLRQTFQRFGSSENTQLGGGGGKKRMNMKIATKKETATA
jgi:hypothetical protein